MGEPYLTWAEIEKIYAGQWVMIDVPMKRRRPSGDDGGRVVVHSADRAEFMRLVNAWEDPGGKFMSVRYAGVFPEEADDFVPVEPEFARQ